MKRLMISAVAVVLWACGGPEADAPSLVSQVRVPLEINGVRYSPEEAEALFGDQVVGFFLNDEAQRQGFAYAFTSEEEKNAFFQKWELEHPRESRAQASEEYSTYYEHINAGGEPLTLPGYVLEPDLTRHGCFMRWKCNLWNDRLSSVAPARNTRYTVLHQHIDYGGAALYLASPAYGGSTLYNLTDLGFNDITSSLSYSF